MLEKKEILKELNILYIEDEKDIRTFTEDSLSKLVKNITIAKDGQEGLDIFTTTINDKDKDNFDLVITDISMPNMNGLEMLMEIHKIDINIPSIITTAYDDAKFLKTAIELGVRGYVMKPMNLFKLIKSIVSSSESIVLRKRLETVNANLEQVVFQRTQQLTETIKRLEINSKELTYEANHDHLTGLYNRQKLNEELKKEIHRELRYKRDLSIVMFDIDHFKKINDTFGHDKGDEVLVKLAQISSKSIRAVDTLSRWGGEEFIILLPETSIDKAKNVTENLKNDLSSIKLPDDTNLSASFGITILREDDTKDTFLKRVDEAMYEAKDNGRDTIVIKS